MKYIKSILLSAFIGILLFKADVNKLTKRARTGILVYLIPVFFGAVLTALTSAGPAGGASSSVQILLPSLWFFIADFGIYPIRLVKRLRNIMAVYDVSILSCACAALVFALANLLARISLTLVMIWSEPLYSLHNILAFICIGLLLGFICFSIGMIFAGIAFSVHEVFVYAPPAFLLIGFVAGFFPQALPSGLSAHLSNYRLNYLSDLASNLIVEEHGALDHLSINQIIVFLLFFLLAIRLLAMSKSIYHHISDFS